MDELSSPDLSRQSLCRALTEEELALADSIEAAFAQGEHDLAALAARLQSHALRRPSGDNGEWTADVLEIELRSINRALDEAYARNGGKRIP